jgi:hypothetical protein
MKLFKRGKIFGRIVRVGNKFKRSIRRNINNVGHFKT